VFGENAEQLRQDLLLLYLKAAQSWSEILTAGGRSDAAIEVCTAALRHDPTNETITRKIYNLHVSANDNISARKVLARYSDALRSDGFTPEESAEILDAFWAAPA
jgi:DNA-binding SARP family transcriptional activator